MGRMMEHVGTATQRGAAGQEQHAGRYDDTCPGEGRANCSLANTLIEPSYGASRCESLVAQNAIWDLYRELMSP